MNLISDLMQALVIFQGVDSVASFGVDFSGLYVTLINAKVPFNEVANLQRLGWDLDHDQTIMVQEVWRRENVG